MIPQYKTTDTTVLFQNWYFTFFPVSVTSEYRASKSMLLLVTPYSLEKFSVLHYPLVVEGGTHEVL